MRITCRNNLLQYLYSAYSHHLTEVVVWVILECVNDVKFCQVVHECVMSSSIPRVPFVTTSQALQYKLFTKADWRFVPSFLTMFVMELWRERASEYGIHTGYHTQHRSPQNPRICALVRVF
jgi:hypothetical protein